MASSLDGDPFELKRMMRQEAHEKSFEIHVLGQRMFEKEKDKIVQEGVQQLNEEYDKKILQLNMNLNIERSTKINKTRLQRMTERNECIEKVKDQTKEKIKNEIISNPSNPIYRELMKKLIMQVSLIPQTLKC